MMYMSKDSLPLFTDERIGEDYAFICKYLLI